MRRKADFIPGIPRKNRVSRALVPCQISDFGPVWLTASRRKVGLLLMSERSDRADVAGLGQAGCPQAGVPALVPDVGLEFAVGHADAAPVHGYVHESIDPGGYPRGQGRGHGQGQPLCHRDRHGLGLRPGHGPGQGQGRRRGQPPGYRCEMFHTKWDRIGFGFMEDYDGVAR